MIENFCFLTEANYPNYVKRVKEFSIKRFLEMGLNIPFYISTNLKEEFSEYENHPLIRVFDVNDLRKDREKSFDFEQFELQKLGWSRGISSHQMENK